ncbi:16S rRNA (cytosine(1402)-N(4))-methyltransferase RsmH [Nitrosophilus alvini]|uniref:16S rRNA (cytosine(1402)-N(4))-methyltransferase RsmH n=1 Tax=Nitrosophilus alvini TaxID=2714855 RepID=UPI00190C77CE|nr:16S rRNA (cytosine(1402)-N(4))-methyltransferase RsmH [Nitrosophilus alvini]
MHIPHIPVLRDEVVEIFSDCKDGYFIDCTVGYGGHSEALLKSNENIKIIGIDRDEEALEFSRKRLFEYKERVRLVRGKFSQKIREYLHLPLCGILADIGVSSLQLDKIERGFSFESPVLDMRMDKSSELTAYDVLNFYEREKLEQIFKEYAEVPYYKKLADIIIKTRSKKPIESAREFAQIISRHFPKSGKIHPATLPFQAVRIEVNDELGELKRLLDACEEARPAGAKLAIITFHSLEDRMVKNRFKKWAKRCICPPESLRCECGKDNALGEILTKKPITATKEEIRANPRSRSAKMRVFRFRV